MTVEPNEVSDTVDPEWLAVRGAARDELARMGTPAPVIPQRLAAARRIWRRGVGLGGVALAHRTLLGDCAEVIALQVSRMLNVRRVARDLHGDYAQDAVQRVLEEERMLDFEHEAARVPDDATDDAVQRAVEAQRRAVARYITGFAWRMWSNETHKDERRSALRAAQLAPTVTVPDDTERMLAEVLDWLHARVERVDRDVFLQCVVEEHPVDEVAARYEISPKAVEGRLYRVRQRLRAWLEGRERSAVLIPFLAANDDLASLLRRLADYARRRGEPAPDEVQRIRERIERDVRAVTSRAPTRPPAGPRTSAGPAAPNFAAISFVAVSALLVPSVRREVVAPPVVATPLAPARAQVVTTPTVAALPTPTTVVAPAVIAPTHAAPRVRAAASEPTTLNREASLLNTAQSALRMRPPQVADALAELEEHARLFPRGQLVELREFLRVRALRLSNRPDEAASAEASFRRRFPESAYLRTLGAPTGA